MHSDSGAGVITARIGIGLLDGRCPLRCSSLSPCPALRMGFTNDWLCRSSSRKVKGCHFQNENSKRLTPFPQSLQLYPWLCLRTAGCLVASCLREMITGEGAPVSISQPGTTCSLPRVIHASLKWNPPKVKAPEESTALHDLKGSLVRDFKVEIPS